MSDAVSGVATPGNGVGPWQGDLPTDSRLDPELLTHGDARNVPDQYRYWTVEAIKADLDRQRAGGPQLWVAIENWSHDFNIGSVVRTANAFNVAGVIIVGKKRWNRRGAMVTDRYLNIFHCETVAEFVTSCGDLPIIGIDNIPGSIPLETFQFPKDCVLVFGQESTGLSPEIQEICLSILHITQFGSTRSINAGAAGAIAMFEWSRQNRTG
ncbi:MAG: rRNA methyltransferase [Cellulomonadaceae bacterium]|nr:rRNA methyltransferase [Cellulomonadaceae bacterium]